VNIVQIGLSHRIAPVEVRERLALPETAIPDALRLLCPQNGCGPGYALEGALLSTCNRLELYAAIYVKSVAAWIRWPWANRRSRARSATPTRWRWPMAQPVR
jgi:glutamyl-tRNA reductase